MSQKSIHRVAIVGGGLSGLSTAVKLRLARPETTITLLEASGRVGGVIDTEAVGDFLVDRGADMFATKPAAAIELMRQLGVEDQLILPQAEGRGARILHHGKLVDLPDGFVLMRATKFWPMLATPLLSWRGKLRFLTERWRGTLTSSDGSQDVSVADFVRHRLGEETLVRLVGPLVAGIYTADVEKLSMEATMAPLAKMEREHGSLSRATAARRRSGEDRVERGSSGARYEQFRAFRGGMIQLIRTLADTLPAGTIRTDCPVSEIRRQDGLWHVSIEQQSDPEPFDDVVLAVPPKHAARLLDPIAPKVSADLASIQSASTAIVVLALRRSDIAKDIQTFGFVVPPVEKRQILAASFASNKFAGRAPEDHVIARVFIGGMLQPHLLQRSDEELVQLAQDELSDLIGFSGQPTLSRVVRWNDAMPQYHVGHRQLVQRIESGMEPIEGLWLTNNAMHGVGIAPVIAAADKLVTRMIQCK